MSSKKSIAFQRAAKLTGIVSQIENVLVSYGYSEVFLPLYEYYDDFKDTVYDFKDENIVKFIDRNTGKSMVLRPDFTPQVCRTVANYMGDAPLPLRLAYKGRVFRNVNLNKGIKSEKYQMGGELFGAESILGDIESVLISTKVMDSLGISDYKIVIGDVNFLNIVLNNIDDQSVYRNCLTGKQFSKLKDVVGKMDVSEEMKSFLVYLPYAFGNASIFDELIEKVSFNSEIVERIQYIKGIFEKLIEMGISTERLVFDAGETRGFDYYTGLNFDIIHEERGVALGGGGRYDRLMENFNYPMSACGVAFNIEEVMRYCLAEEVGNDFDYLVVGEENLAKAESLRKEGFSVFWISKESDKEKIVSWYKFKNIL